MISSLPGDVAGILFESQQPVVKEASLGAVGEDKNPT